MGTEPVSETLCSVTKKVMDKVQKANSPVPSVYVPPSMSDLRGKICEDGDRVKLVQNSVQWRTFVLYVGPYDITA
jgi:hypothetical protein